MLAGMLSLTQVNEMTYRGRVQNGVIVLENPSALPEVAQVEVTPTGEEDTRPTLAEIFKDIIGKAEGLPADSSINHDHYLYGTPKK
jgi:hypothetical protein